jgi:hypothetical protein
MLIPLEVETRFATKMKFRLEKKWRLWERKHPSAGKPMILIGKGLITPDKEEHVRKKQESPCKIGRY